MLALRVKVALQLLKGSVVRDRAGIETFIGDFDPALGCLDDSVSFADSLIGSTCFLLLGFDFGFELGNEWRTANLVENRLKFPFSQITLDIDFLELLQPFEVHG